MPSSFEKKLISTLRTVREKPKAVRQMYALVVAGGTTSLVVVVWVTAVVFAGYYPTMTPLKEGQLTAAVQASQENAAAFKNEFANQVQTSPAHEQVNQLLQEFKQLQESASASANIDGIATTGAGTSTDTDTGVVTPPPPPPPGLPSSSSTNIDANTDSNTEYGTNY